MKIRRSLLSIAILATATMVGCNSGTNQTSQGSSSSPKDSKMVVITKDNFRDVVLNSDKPVLVDFWASWCSPCRALMPTMEELAEKHEGKIVIGKVDVDAQQELAREYNVQSIPRLIYFKNGEKVIDDGGTGKSEIESEIASLTKLK